MILFCSGEGMHLMFWIIGLMVVVIYVANLLDLSSRGTMTMRQFYKDEYRLEWREENDPLLCELKMSMMRIF